MKTKDFIKQNQGYVPSKEKRCASVYQDTVGNFYSYGPHYPLFFQYCGTWILNTKGYSVTTARHISYCRGLEDIAIDLDGDITCANVADAIKRKIDSLLNVHGSEERKKNLTYYLTRFL